MKKRSLSEDVLSAVQRRTGKAISKDSLRKIAGTVTPETTDSDRQLRRLIEQVSKVAGVRVTEETMQDLIRTIRNNKVSPANMMSLLKQMNKK